MYKLAFQNIMCRCKDFFTMDCPLCNHDLQKFLHKFITIHQGKMYKGRRWSQQRRQLARDVTERNSVLANSYSLVRHLAFCLSCYTSRYSKKLVPKSELYIYIYISGVPSPQKQWMNYTTNRTLHLLLSIHRPLRGKWIKQLKLFIILSIFRICCSITK